MNARPAQSAQSAQSNEDVSRSYEIPREISDETFKTILKQYKTIAVVGLSPDPGRPSHHVAHYLIDEGYEVYGVNPLEKTILGRPCYPTLADVPVPIDIVDIFRAPQHIPAIVEEAVRLKAKVIWLQEGIAHPKAEETARLAGLIAIADKCILKEHLRLLR